MRKLDEGIDIIFDEEMGLIDKETGNIIIDIKLMYYTGKDLSDEEDNKEIITSEKIINKDINSNNKNKDIKEQSNSFEEEEEKENLN